MRIGIELNGVLRDTIGKIIQVYQKHFIDGHQDYFSGKTYKLDSDGNTEENTENNEFKYEIISEVTTADLLNHFKFQSKDELYDFLYRDHTMEIFGHAGSVETYSMNDFNELYLDLRDNHDILILSDEIGKSKPASLFFLSKFGCLVETVKFYSEYTIKDMWDYVDVLVTANPRLLDECPDDKMVIKFNTPYNKNIDVMYSISTIKELKNKLLEIYD
jgi:hypothetical protein